VYGHDGNLPRPALAARMLEERPGLAQGHLLLACAAGDEAALRKAIAADPASIHRTGDPWLCPDCKRPLDMPPLVAVTHSSLSRLPAYRDRLLRCARLLCEAGAEPRQSWQDGDDALSALYGAAGKNHDPEMTRILLDAGADPNDGESLYHAMETRDLSCARLLLEFGARVEGSNALHHELDTDNIEGLLLLLAHTKDPIDSMSSLGSPLLWAIKRGRSPAHVKALLDAGADPEARTQEGVSAYGLALQYGLVEAADMLAERAAFEPLSIEDEFVAACARGDKEEALRILARKPDVLSSLSLTQLHQLPNLAAAGNDAAVRVMVELGWPIAIRGGDWGASALNLAVFRGDSALARFLLDHGASWAERHGFDHDVRGTLAWASRNHEPEDGDWVGCARAMIEHGLSVLELDGTYSDEVAEFLAAERAKLEDRADVD
jgi:ankyrin repeat protein